MKVKFVSPFPFTDIIIKLLIMNLIIKYVIPVGMQYWSLGKANAVLLTLTIWK